MYTSNMRHLAFLFIVLFFSGCAGARIQNVLDSWIGSPEGELIEKWGLPDKTLQYEKGVVYEYRTCGRETGIVAPTEYASFYMKSQNCGKWVFGIQNQEIVHSSYIPEN